MFLDILEYAFMLAISQKTLKGAFFQAIGFTKIKSSILQ
jgi:hypothetical protein